MDESTSAGAQRKFLITIGVSTYRDSQISDLPGAAKDAERVRRLLVPMGYEVVLSDLSAESARNVPVAVERWAVKEKLSAQDVVVVYFAGHGVAEEDRHYLQFSDTEDGLASTALASEELARPLMRSQVGHLLVMLDTCYAGAGTNDVARLAGGLIRSQPTAAGRWMLAAARGKQTARDTAFVDALTATLAHPQAGARQEFLSVREVTTRINAYFKDNALVQRASHSVVDSDGQVSFFNNPAYIPNLPAGDLDVATLAVLRKRVDRHFLPRARGVEHAGNLGDYFAARTAALRELTAWLRADRHDRLARVVTGRPGSGKSALLGRLMLLADPDEPARARTSPDALPPAGLEIVPLHARRATRDSLTRDLAATLDTPAADLDELLQILAERSAPLVIVVDALDEAGTAGDPNEGMRIGRELLRPMTSMPTVRLIIGTRDPLIRTLGRAIVVLDLDDPRYIDTGDVAGYARDVLLDVHDPDSRSPYCGNPTVAATIGQAIASRAGTSFLVARMTAAALVQGQITIDTTTPGWRDTLPSDATEAFAAYLARFGQHRSKVERLLRPLAYAQGAGLPWSTLWGPLAEALSGVPCPRDDLRWLQEHAGAYLLESTAHHDSVFRLFHETMAEHLRTPGHDRQAHHAITTTLLEHVPLDPITGRRVWANAHPYILDHLATHAAAASQLDDLITDPLYLVYANPDQLLVALHTLTTNQSRLTAAIYRHSATIHRHLTTRRRQRLLAIDAARFNSSHHQQTFSQGLTWIPRWATGQQTSIALRATSTGHTSWVNAMAVSEVDGRAVAVTASNDRTVRVWHLDDGSERTTFAGHTEPVNVVAVAEVGGRPVAVSVSDDGAVRVWHLDDGSERTSTSTDHTDWAVAVAVAEVDGRPVAVSVSDDGAVRVWHLDDGSERATFAGHPDSVNVVAVAEVSGRPVAVTASAEGAVRVWHLDDGSERATLIGHTNSVEVVVVTEVDGREVAITASADRTVRVWHLDDGSERTTFAGHTDSVNVVAVAEVDGRPVAVSAGDDEAVWVWNLDDGSERTALTGHTNSVRALAVTEVDGRPVAVSAGDDETVRVWNLDDGSERTTLTGHTYPVRAAAVTEVDGRPVAVSVSDDGTVRVWDLAMLAEERERDGHTADINQIVAISKANQAWLISASRDSTVRVWTLDDGAESAAFTGHTDSVRAVAVAEVDGRPVAVSVSDDGTVRVWHVEDGSERASFTGLASSMRGVAVAEVDGRPVAVGVSADGAVRVWHLDDGSERTTLTVHNDSVNALAVSEVDGRPVAVGVSADGAVQVWHLDDGSERAAFTGHNDSVNALAVSEVDGRAVAITASADRTVRVWHLDDASEHTTLTGHTNSVEAVSVTEVDGRPVAISASEDGTVRLWNLDDGSERSAPTHRVRAVSVTEVDGRPTMITSSRNRTISVWDLTTDTEIDVIDYSGHPTAGLVIGPGSRLAFGAGWDVIVLAAK
ncbi:caspase family protein [Amycolatopsis sp. NPDC051758]|uniref:caspase family protein n=1 Tax=Amycolatopsis sp. NPDC051758 TaxID=3363935 RepID=UPI00378AB603